MEGGPMPGGNCNLFNSKVALKNVCCVCVCSTVGYSWLPLLRDGRLSSQEFSIPVSCNLPAGYLALKEPGSTKVEREGGKHLWISKDRGVNSPPQPPPNNKKNGRAHV